MSILMGVTMSFGLSLCGNLLSGQFTVQGFLMSFLISTLISLVIGFLVPMKRVGDAGHYLCDGPHGISERDIPRSADTFSSHVPPLAPDKPHRRLCPHLCLHAAFHEVTFQGIQDTGTPGRPTEQTAGRAPGWTA